MGESPKRIDVFLETGQKRTFVGALEWPGWCRSGRDEPAALQALLDYGPRYAGAVRSARFGFISPASTQAFVIAERLRGDASTDFGAPAAAPAADLAPVGEDDLHRLAAVLKACWKTFDAAVARASGRALRKGPRGGGRTSDEIVRHVLDADEGYFAMIGQKLASPGNLSLAARLRRHPADALQALELAVRQGVASRGPRGGRRWTPRYFVRRSAWHVLDHAWEIEDRLE